MIQLGVNIDHVATLRQARRADEPDPVWAAVEAELGGADGITFHLREDRRHISDRDAELLKRTVATKLNMELSINAAIVKIALKLRPDQCTLVPERRAEVTTEGGLDVAGQRAAVKAVVRKLKAAGIVTSAFIEPDETQIVASRDCGFDAVELWTGGYAHAKTEKERDAALDRLERGVELGQEYGLVTHGGHGLTYRNVGPVAAISGFYEFNIGHSIVSRAVLIGMREAVREMKRVIDSSCHHHVALIDADDLAPAQKQVKRAMAITAIYDARLLDHDDRWTVRLADGRVQGVEPFDPARAGAEVAAAIAAQTALDAGGGLLTPALVDAHLHLDLAYSLDVVKPNQSGTLLEAIGHWSEAKRTLTPENVFARAMQAIDDEISGGTGFIRSHVDVATSAGMRLAEGVLAAREATKALCDIQLVAFPQDGLLCDPGAEALMRRALEAGVDVVGGIPHFERTATEGVRHLEILFKLAKEYRRDIDVHIDETDDPSSRYTEYLASLAIQHRNAGWTGRVTASHVCALASYDDVHAARVIGLLAGAGVSVVTNPGVNLHLQGRFDTYPKRRGLTRVRELRARGVSCAAGQDCIRDPFYPLGNGHMLDQAFLLVHADHLSLPAQIRDAFDMVCGGAAEVVGRKLRRIEAGANADLALFPVESVHDLVRLRPRPTHVMHRGELVG